MIISLISSKGGAAKTTSSIYLACAAHSANPDLDIRLIDADPQQSALDWADTASRSSDGLSFPVFMANDAQIGNLTDDGLTIIDTAPSFTTLTRTIIGKSDLCIITASPTPLDIRRAWKTVNVCGDKAAILITRANTRTKDFRETLASLKEDGANFFDTVIRSSVHYSQAFGTNPRKLYDYAQAWQEIREATNGIE